MTDAATVGSVFSMAMAAERDMATSMNVMLQLAQRDCHCAE